MQYSILIAEDDLDIQSLLKLYLGNAGFRVLTADNGRSALSILQEDHIDLALLDIMMPEANGYQVMEELRKTSNIPVLVLSAKDQDYDRILGLNLGADAYLTKPFNPLEVVAQVQASLRRFYRLGSGEQHEGTVFRLGALTLDLERMRLLKEGRTVDLTPTEFRVLSRMMQSPGRVFTKAQLYDSLNGIYTESDEKTMMVHISKLREKIEDDPKNPDYIKTVRGLGYKIEYTE